MANALYHIQHRNSSLNQQPAPSFKDKLAKTGPRKLLACDGGGIRGMISVEILARIEKELRAASGKPGLVLADYFDYVAGTSTGAIIATLVALGFSMDEAREFYLKSGAEMFQPAKTVGAAAHQIRRRQSDEDAERHHRRNNHPRHGQAPDAAHDRLAQRHYRFPLASEQ